MLYEIKYKISGFGNHNMPMLEIKYRKSGTKIWRVLFRNDIDKTRRIEEASPYLKCVYQHRAFEFVKYIEIYYGGDIVEYISDFAARLISDIPQPQKGESEVCDIIASIKTNGWRRLEIEVDTKE